MLDIIGISCGEPEVVVDARRTGTYLYGDIVVYTCQSGFVLTSGDVTLECQADGRWEGEAPHCTGYYAYYVI